MAVIQIGTLFKLFFDPDICASNFLSSISTNTFVADTLEINSSSIEVVIVLVLPTLVAGRAVVAGYFVVVVPGVAHPRRTFFVSKRPKL